MKIILIAFSFVVSVIAENEQCDNFGILFYEDLGCTPNYAKNKRHNCPTSYTCPKITQNPSECQNNGITYSSGQVIDDPSLCQNCTCTGGNITSHILCKYRECPNQVPKQGCHFRNKLGECCATEEYCPKNATRNSCIYKQFKYRDGQYFVPENTCSECMCSEGFKGKLEKPYCRRQQCNTELYYPKEIRESCTPVYSSYSNYIKPALCCPYEFICDEEIGSVMDISRGASSKAMELCQFAGKNYKKGDVIKVTNVKSAAEYHVTCACNVGPLMTCIREDDYYY